MKIVFFVCLSILVVLLFLFCPIKTIFNLVLDSELKGVYFSLKMWFIKLSSGKFEIENNEIVKNVSTSKLLKLRKPKEQSMFFVIKLMKQLKLNKFYFVLKVPPLDDYYEQTYLIGLFNEIICSFVNAIKNDGSDYILSTKINYDSNISNLVCESLFFTNMFGIIYSLIFAKIKTIKLRRVWFYEERR